MIDEPGDLRAGWVEEKRAFFYCQMLKRLFSGTTVTAFSLREHRLLGCR